MLLPVESVALVSGRLDFSPFKTLLAPKKISKIPKIHENLQVSPTKRNIFPAYTLSNYLQIFMNSSHLPIYVPMIIFTTVRAKLNVSKFDKN